MTNRSPWLGLAVLALPALLVSIDVFVLLLALPRIGADLHASSTEQLWILDVYGFLLSGSMITMGTLGDRIGRRRMLLIGAAAFGAASVAAAYSGGPVMLIAARAVLGIAGATLAPSALALISGLFPDPRRRGLAIGVWMVCFMSGAIIGPVVGGLLLQHFWWGSAFLLGVPPMILLLVLGPILLPEQRHPGAGRFDLPSVGLSLAAILPAVYGVKELARDGWRPVPLLALAAGLAFGAVFVRRQRTLADPLLDLRLFGDRGLSAALAAMSVGTMMTGAMMVFVTQHLQLVDGLSPRAAGLWILPAAVASALSFQVAPLLARRVRPGRLIAGGLLVSALGALCVPFVPAGAGPLPLVAAFVVSNLGMGPTVTLATGIVLGAAPPERAGAAGALNEVSGEFGYALGIALLGSLGTAVYRAVVDLPPGLPAAASGARDTVTAAADAAAVLPPATAEAVLHAARAAATTGLHVVAVVCAAALAALAVAAGRLLRHLPPLGGEASLGGEPSLGGEAPAADEDGGRNTTAAKAR
ncbi:MFS transporter [Dactylosporangium sp. CA-092794]|uniref:MFS transporter n=1 Tax=Dactylosporangium sp. CA-092794 TaxID=3239929 RepID=UPI003D90D2CA